jgi:predicted GNAT family acetyltransferase
MDWKYEKGRIYSVNENNEIMAEATFIYKENGEVNINRTYVNPVLRGQGVAGKIMQALSEYLRENSLKATASCSYANAWLKKNRCLYQDIISEDFDGGVTACELN